MSPYCPHKQKLSYALCFTVQTYRMPHSTGKPPTSNAKATFRALTDPSPRNSLADTQVCCHGGFRDKGHKLYTYTRRNKNQALQIFQVSDRKWCQCTAGFIHPVICNRLVFVRLSFLCLPLIPTIYARCLLSRHQYVCLIWRKKTLMLMTFLSLVTNRDKTEMM
jgi:hypothetical protein